MAAACPGAPGAPGRMPACAQNLLSAPATYIAQRRCNTSCKTGSSTTAAATLTLTRMTRIAADVQQLPQACSPCPPHCLYSLIAMHQHHDAGQSHTKHTGFMPGRITADPCAVCRAAPDCTGIMPVLEYCCMLGDPCAPTPLPACIDSRDTIAPGAPLAPPLGAWAPEAPRGVPPCDAD